MRPFVVADGKPLGVAGATFVNHVVAEDALRHKAQAYSGVVGRLLEMLGIVDPSHLHAAVLGHCVDE